MAIPIAPTPVLEGDDALEFFKKIQREENDRIPIGNPSLKLAAISKKILERGKKRTKADHQHVL